jgi:hypothetical protein
MFAAIYGILNCVAFIRTTKQHINKSYAHGRISKSQPDTESYRADKTVKFGTICDEHLRKDGGGLPYLPIAIAKQYMEDTDTIHRTYYNGNQWVMESIKIDLINMKYSTGILIGERVYLCEIKQFDPKELLYSSDED